MLSKNIIKHLNALQRKKFRNESGEFILEGEKMVLEAVQLFRGRIVKVYCLSEFSMENDLSEVDFELIEEKELKQISGLTTPNKALAILRQEVVSVEKNDFYLALDGIQDPGNMGTIIRLADWFGLKQIICSPDCVDCYNPKVVQATMGSILRVRLHYTDLVAFFKQTDLPVYGTLLDGENVYQKQLQRKGILLMGNEGNGIRPELFPLISSPLTIPRFGEAESLNVGIATAILLSEFSRG